MASPTHGSKSSFTRSSDFHPGSSATNHDDEEEDSIPLVPTTTTLLHARHARKSTEDSGQHHMTSDDDEDEEILSLMRRSYDQEHAKEHVTPEQPLFKDEDLDIDSAAAMVRRVSLAKESWHAKSPWMRKLIFSSDCPQ
jgi:hypothetical protein